MKPDDQTPPPVAADDPDYELNEADDLRAEDRAAKVRDRYAEEDRKDRAGPHYFYR
jgi:hypothetical protein